MGKHSRVKGGPRAGGVAAMAVATAVLVSILAPGCGPATPQDVVNKFIDAIQENNWSGYLSSILPENVRSMTNEETNQRREVFKEHREEFEDVKLEVKSDKKDKDKAEVVMVGGTVSRMNPQTGEMETRSIKEFPEEQRTIKARKYKGRWYVDIVLASPAEPTEGTEPPE